MQPHLRLLPDPDRFSLRTYRGAGGVHAHAHAQAVLPLHGTMALAFGARRGEVHGGEGVVIPAGLPHAFGADGPNRFVVLDFHAAVAEGRFFALDAGLSHLLAYVQALGERSALATDVERHATALLCDAVQRLLPSPGGTGLVARAIHLLHERLAEPLRIDRLARELGVSPGHLHAEFRRATGTTPARHLGRLRLERAATLLGKGRWSITQVAHACGFSEHSALTRAMRRGLGTTPAALQRAARGSPPSPAAAAWPGNAGPA